MMGNSQNTYPYLEQTKNIAGESRFLPDAQRWNETLL